MMQDILDLLEEKSQPEKPTDYVFQETAPVLDRRPREEAQSRPILVREERQLESSETLEAAGGKSHDRFHDKYIRPLEAPPVNVPAHFLLSKDGTSIRRAVIWSEILGTPKGLQ